MIIILNYKTNSVFNWQKKLTPPTDGGAISSTEVPEPLTRHPDRRLVYEPNCTENSRPSGSGDNSYAPRRGSYVAFNHVDPNHVRHFSNSRDRVSKTRNRGPQYGGTGHQYYRNGYESSPRNWYTNRPGYNRENDYLQSTPIYTHNRFVSLRDDGPRDTHRDSYQYMNKEDDEFSRSPFNYNHN